MTTFVSFRLGAAAIVALALSLLTPAEARCAGRETDGARLAADLSASARVVAAELRAGLMLVRDPDEAFAQLKEALDDVRGDAKLSARGRERLESRLEGDLRDLVVTGRSVKELQDQWAGLKAELRIRLGLWRLERER
jgi:hypothetical protein